MAQVLYLLNNYHANDHATILGVANLFTDDFRPSFPKFFEQQEMNHDGWRGPNGSPCAELADWMSRLTADAVNFP
jgi:hypothetical protein